MNEEWKEIKGNREVYEVSNLGNVRTKDRIGARGRFCKGRVLAQCENSSGYLRVAMNLTGNSKYYFVHRLVAEYFKSKKENKEYVNHINGNKKDNRVENLEWCTRSENEKHAWRTGLKKGEMVSRKGERHGMHKLRQEQVDWIRTHYKKYDKEFGSNAMAMKLGVSPQTITDIVNNRSWKHE